MRLVRSCLVAVLIVILLQGSSKTAWGEHAHRLDSANIEIAHMMLHQAYIDVKKNYYDPAYHGVDLDASYYEYDALLDNAQSVNQLFEIISAFLTRLHDSHTFFIPPMRAAHWTLGFNMEMVGDQCFVTGTRPGSDAALKLHPGDRVLKIDGFRMERASFLEVQYFLGTLSAVKEHGLTVESPSGQLRTETVLMVARETKALLGLTNPWSIVWDNEEDAQLNRERVFQIGDVLIWKMPSFSVGPDVIQQVFSKARNYKVLIIDLRGNPGGAVDTLKAALGSVFDHPVKLGTRVSRKGSKTELIRPQREPFRGKVIVLIDSQSASAAELFARVIQLEHRGEVIGDRSAGAVMEARWFGESVGTDTRIFYGLSVTTANLVMSDGKSLENLGVTPDKILLPTAEDLAMGNDQVLSFAAGLAGAKLDPAVAGKLFPFEWPTL